MLIRLHHLKSSALYLQNRNGLRELTSGYGGWSGVEVWREGIVREFGIDMYTPLYLTWVTNKDPLYSTGNSAHYYVTA